MMGVKSMVKVALIGVAVSALYWGLNSAVMAYLLHAGSFMEQFFQPDVHHLWMRVPTVLLLIAAVPIISKLINALTKVRTLSGLIPICAWCKKIRDDEGYWKAVEAYIGEHTKAEFTHGMCPECQNKYFAEHFTEENSKENNNCKVS